MTEAQAIADIKKTLKGLQISLHKKDMLLTLMHAQKTMTCCLTREQKNETSSTYFYFPYHVFVRRPDLFSAAIQSQFQMNTRVFARTCELQKISKTEAEVFLNTHHVLGAAGSVSNYALVKNKEVLAVATFSNGRKMRRLPEAQRSFELIRFCNKSGVTVSGGLTKLLQHFIREKNPGDIMTYVDAGYSSGSAYLKAGFEKHSETESSQFLIDTTNYSTLPFDEALAKDSARYYTYHHKGNIKLVYTPSKQL